MPQLSLYVDQTTLDLVTKAARAENTSVSKLVTQILARKLDDSWPPGFADTYGQITDSSFATPTEVDSALDSPRDTL